MFCMSQGKITACFFSDTQSGTPSDTQSSGTPSDTLSCTKTMGDLAVMVLAASDG
jgi:hypothetical protein